MKATARQASAKRAFLAGGSAIAVMVCLATPARAQDDEIIVTAQKRAESIQDVPLAISAFSGDFVRDTNLDDIKDIIKFTPGVSGNSFDSFIDFVNVRGIRTNDFGVGGDPSIPFFKNGLYQGRNGAVVTSNFDMERAEVLRGPQGFLFGRNAIGGAISVHTARPNPDAFSGYVDLDIGQRDRLSGEVAVNIPLSEHFAVRLAGYGTHEDGYVDNLARPGLEPQNEPEKYAGRFSALYARDAVEVLFTAEYENRRQSGTLYRATGAGDQFDTLVGLFGLTIAGDGRDIDSDQGLGEADNAQVASFGLQVDFDLGAATLTSLTGYKDHEFVYAEDFDGTSLNINDYAQDQEGEYFEQELRLVSNGDGDLSWYVGASYYDENIDALFSQHGNEDVMCAYYNYYGFTNCADYFAYFSYAFAPSVDDLLEQNQIRGRYHGFAAYVDINYKITDKFDLGVGVRYSDDTKEFGIRALPVSSQLGPFFALGFTTTDFLTDTGSWDALTPRFIARYRANDNWTWFASATRGFKAGGFGSFSIDDDTIPFCGPFSTSCLNLQPGDALPDEFDPERAWSYEAGVKGLLAGGKMRFDANVYYYRYRDLQQTTVGQGGGIIVQNIGRVKGWGIEGSMDTDLGPYLGLRLSGAYTGSDATEVQAICDDTDLCEGNSLQQVPKFSGSAVATFDYPMGPGTLRAAAELVAQTRTFGGAFQLPEAINPGYHDLSLRYGYVADAGWSVLGYVENVTNELYYTGSEEPGGIIPAHFIGPSRPRTFGVRLSYEFGG